MGRYIFYNNVTGDIYNVKDTTSARAERYCTTNTRMNVSCILESDITGSVFSTRTQEMDLTTTPFSLKKVVIATPTASDNAKQTRNRLLVACDWTQGADSPLSDAKKIEWQTYRQALRDFDYNSITQDHGIVWPSKPS
jgi:hypothetical protein